MTPYYYVHFFSLEVERRTEGEVSKGIPKSSVFLNAIGVFQGCEGLKNKLRNVVILRPACGRQA
jgi:hypothetical protein